MRWLTRGGRLALAGAALSLALALGGCTGPVKTTNVYESKAGQTAKVVGSAVETARLTVEAAGRGKAFGRSVTQILLDAERDADAAQGTFEAIQPPDDRADTLRDQLVDLLDRAVPILTELRVAARRGRLAELPKLAAPLAELSGKLAEFAEEYA